MIRGFDEGYAEENGQKLSISCLDFHTKHIGCIAAMHYHDYIEILYGINCKCKIRIDDNIFDFKSGDICFVSPKSPHHIVSEESPSIYFVIKFSPNILFYEEQTFSEMKYILPVMRSQNGFKNVITRDKLNNNKLEQIIEDIYFEWYNARTGREFVIRGQLLRLFAELTRIWNIDTGSIYNINESDITAKKILECANYMYENYLTIDEKQAAAFCNMSYNYFSHNFKRIVGVSFTKYLLNIKLESAKRLLLTSQKSITEIAMETNFSTSSHFIAEFKKKFNITPGNYRKFALDSTILPL